MPSDLWKFAMRALFTRAIPSLLFSMLIPMSGCNTATELLKPLDEVPVPGMKSRAKPDQQFRQSREMAAKFQSDGDSEAFQWIIRHRLKNGMSLGEVSRAFGNDGEPIENDTELRANSNLFHPGDKAYKWGPDQNGKVVILFFRNGRMIGFQSPQDQE